MNVSVVPFPPTDRELWHILSVRRLAAHWRSCSHRLIYFHTNVTFFLWTIVQNLCWTYGNRSKFHQSQLFLLFAILSTDYCPNMPTDTKFNALQQLMSQLWHCFYLTLTVTIGKSECFPEWDGQLRLCPSRSLSHRTISPHLKHAHEKVNWYWAFSRILSEVFVIYWRDLAYRWNYLKASKSTLEHHLYYQIWMFHIFAKHFACITILIYNFTPLRRTKYYAFPTHVLRYDHDMTVGQDSKGLADYSETTAAIGHFKLSHQIQAKLDVIFGVSARSYSRMTSRLLPS